MDGTSGVEWSTLACMQARTLACIHINCTHKITHAYAPSLGVSHSAVPPRSSHPRDCLSNPRPCAATPEARSAPRHPARAQQRLKPAPPLAIQRMRSNA
eukprot:366215-Chlamydomonas_euryale.AAC.5